MKHVLVTGAFGNVGQNTIHSLIERGHDVTAFDLDTKQNRKAAKRLSVRTVWGDIRKLEDVEQAVENQDVVIHLAFIIPSLSATGVSSESEPIWAQEINVGGTRNVIAAMEAQALPPKLIFASSCAIYGRTQDRKPPRTVDETPSPIEHYSRHKVLCEQMVRSSKLTWAITRFAAALPITMIMDKGMFGVPLSDRMEFVHTRDLGDALANTVNTEEVWFKTLHLGGGPRCQLYYQEIANQVLDAVGIGTLPEEAFTSIPFHTDWLDTRESQELLHYQTRTLDDYVNDIKVRLGWRARAVRLLRPFVKRYILAKSLPYRRAHAPKAWEGRIALITGASQGIGEAIAKELALDGFKVVLTARNQQKLEHVAESITAFGGTAQIIPADLTVPEERRRLLATIRRDLGPIDILINNAGMGWYGYASKMPVSQVDDMIALNIQAVTDLSLSALSEMTNRGSGHIVNIGSIVGRIPSQGVALYSASKAYIDALTTALHRESRGSGVNVSLILAGAVSTDFYDKAGMNAIGNTFLVNRWAIAPEQIARTVTALLKRPRRVVHAPWEARLGTWTEFWFGWIMDRIGPALLRQQSVGRTAV